MECTSHVVYWPLYKPISFSTQFLLQLDTMGTGCATGVEAATDDLLRFIDAADGDFTVTSTTSAAATADSASEEETAAASSTASTTTTALDIWSSISRALDDWTQRIVDTEVRHRNKRATFRQRVGAALQRMQGDGLLNRYDIDELQYVADLWSHLLSASSCYSVGGVFAKRDIITYLLELYSLHQISRELVVEACLQL